MNNQNLSKPKSNNLLNIGLTLVFLVFAVMLAIFTFNKISALVSTWEITDLPGLPLSAEPTPAPQPGDEGEAGTNPAQSPAAIPVGPTPESWDGASRVTVLVLGLDYNDWRADDGPPRTDTMILLTIDPMSQTAGMLSIPRDLWVSIPGFDYGKINTAYQLGEAYNLPGGGPGLAVDTVERLIGVPIQYYAQIDFTAFVRFIDEIGGVKIDVPYEIDIDIYGDAPEGKKHLEPGIQVLPGDHALAYARARNSEGADFDRAQRQQQVIMAFRNRILRYDMIPTLVAKAPTLYQEISSGINTNLSLDESLQLALLAQQIPEEDILRGIIGSEHISFGKSPDGLDVLKPRPDQIRLLRDQIFASSGAISPVAGVGADPLELIIAENARLYVLNGTLTPGLAGRTSEYLQSLGINVQAVGDASEKPYAYTNIYDHTGNPYAVAYLVEVMGISQFRIHSRYAPDSDVDVSIILGTEWEYNNPMP